MLQNAFKCDYSQIYMSSLFKSQANFCFPLKHSHISKNEELLALFWIVTCNLLWVKTSDNIWQDMWFPIGKVLQHYFKNFMEKMLAVQMPIVSLILVIVSKFSRINTSQNTFSDISFEWWINQDFQDCFQPRHIMGFWESGTTPLMTDCLTIDAPLCASAFFSLHVRRSVLRLMVFGTF